MATHKRFQVYQTIYQQRLMPLFYHSDIEVCRQVVLASYRAGARLFEFTNRGDFALEVFSRLKRELAAQAPELMLGVGSIHDAPTAALFLSAGAEFIVTPSLKPEVIALCNTRKVACLPGCATLTEISEAETQGCEIVKLFPADLLGPSFIKAIKAPQPWSSLMPSGGVEFSQSSVHTWLEAGAVCLGMGSALFPSAAIQEQDWTGIEQRVRTMLTWIQEQNRI
ncbi:MAG: bifunctional 4-hydroxy-2-oxoglutarate aldolase/2-dehydro-3-deoxy-phosphogluconate aldolase [Cytophagaceae bacterium]|jgi:2-dehydro-3-deoxyphosphogluconate aldolase/(4S)-4-hydroxy-2-oxoglutarate aldolase|nr:bifunctional 4-hydroxy-2-oxoglutarate aldolase/2-dehydro-3-deoxy-phosphogluconate aldolase [Cytophagaceae bacterium]